MRRFLDQRLKLRQMRAVVAIAAQGSLLGASRHLGVSQPALTKTLHEAEELVGTRLFERHSRGVNPTAAGLVMAVAARRMMAELGRLEAELDRLSTGAGGTLALGAMPVAAGGMLPGVLARLKRLHPDLLVRMTEGTTEDLLPALASGDLDLVVGRMYPPPVPDGLMRMPHYEEPFAVVARAGHPIFSAGVPLPAALRDYELVLPTIGQRIGQELERLLATLDLTPAAALRSTSSSFIREMLHSTDCVSITPGLLMAGDLLRGTLRLVPMPPGLLGPPRPAGLIVRSDRATPPAAEALVACLHATLADLRSRGLAGITGSDGGAEPIDGAPTPAR